MNRYLLLTILLLSASRLMAQSLDEHAHSHDLHRYHLGIGVAATHLSAENGIKPGFHIHLIRQLGKERRWGVGLGYEALADGQIHNGLNLLFNVRPFEGFSLTAAPGITAGKHDGKTEILPAAHFEALYEINIGGIHLGPMAGFGIDSEDHHFSLGIHLGIGLN